MGGENDIPEYGCEWKRKVCEHESVSTEHTDEEEIRTTAARYGVERVGFAVCYDCGSLLIDEVNDEGRFVRNLKVITEEEREREG